LVAEVARGGLRIETRGRVASAIVVAARYKSKSKDDEGNVHYEYSDRQVANRHNEKAGRIEKLRQERQGSAPTTRAFNRRKSHDCS
jgi:hypothetical protein